MGLGANCKHYMKVEATFRAKEAGFVIYILSSNTRNEQFRYTKFLGARLNPLKLCKAN